MSEENVESFKRMVEAWNRDDFDAWIYQFDPEVEWSTLVEVYRGHCRSPAGLGEPQGQPTTQGAN